MNEHLISVIIPVYNTAEYLPRCLDSILNNTYKHLEILCINDGSKDNSLEVLNGYAAKDPRVRVIDQENAGVSAARNRGLDEATGDYVAFVDSDDWIHERSLEIMHRCLEEYHAQLCTTSCLEVRTPSADAPLDWQELEVVPADENFIVMHSCAVWGKLYRADLLAEMRFRLGVRMGEDAIFNLDLFQQFPEIKVVRCTSALYYYFFRESSAYNTLKPITYLPMIEWYLDHLTSAHTDKQRQLYMEESIKNFLFWRYASMFFASLEEKQLQKDVRSRLVKELRSTCSMRVWKRFCYHILLRVPVSYRLFRILSDPTMLGWERQQRQKAREAKQH